MPKNGAKKRRRQIFIRLSSVVIKGLLVKRLVLTEIRKQPSLKVKAARLGIP